MTGIPEDLWLSQDIHKISMMLENLDRWELPLYFIKKIGVREQVYNIMCIVFTRQPFQWNLRVVDARFNQDFLIGMLKASFDVEQGRPDLLTMVDFLTSNGYHAIVGIRKNGKMTDFWDTSKEDYEPLSERFKNLNHV